METGCGSLIHPSSTSITAYTPPLHLEKNMPKKYIYEPWSAPLSVQEKAKCVIGRDYPKPVVNHGIASKECKRRIGEAYALNLPSDSLETEEKLCGLRRKLEEDNKDIATYIS
ncbi:(6-4)DNA photolyase protein [Dioscorea alata]|uniref:(6-4)DNA photolyase protein n=1 Tax=Dioscorea alata TaxID=55571 RepID=A0ACB7W2T4_DIOAL|nr:(6-4)DNA photolyase protein [Dioscorea alata]